MAMQSHSADGDTIRWLAAAQPVPEFGAPVARSAWLRQRRSIRSRLGMLLGRFPPRPRAPAVHILAREDRGDYVVERFQFDNGAGSIVPGYLLLPPSEGPFPAILYCHWHGEQYEVGKEELFQRNAVPVAPGPELVRRGYAVMAIDACGFGERNGRGPGGIEEKGVAGELTTSKYLLWTGRTLWGLIVRDDLMALDYLCSRPEVDARRIGVTGISMGSTRTWWIMALDDRPAAGVGVCCLTRYQDLIRRQGLRHHGIYHYVPGLLAHFDIEAVVALAAPRPLLFLSGAADEGSPVEGVRTVASKVKPVYRLSNAERDFQSVIYPGVGHRYTPAMWGRMLAWMERHLDPGFLRKKSGY